MRSAANRLMLTMLTAIFISLGLLTALNWYAIKQVSVEGAAYQKIASGKDILADILPPPAYLIEAYSVSLEMLEERDPAEIERSSKKLEQLKKEFLESHEYWARTLQDENLRKLELKDYETGQEFLNRAILVQVPLLQKQKWDEARELHRTAIAPMYKNHRAAVDQLVKSATEFTKRIEEESHRMVAESQTNALLLSIVISVILLGFGVWIIRRNMRAQEQAQETLRQINADLDRRVTERTAQLTEARDQLAAVNAALEKRVEERTANLLQATNRLSTVFNSVQDALIIHDLEGRILDINPAASGLYQCRKEEMTGRPVSEFSQTDKPIDAERSEWLALVPGNPERKEWTFRGLDGRNINVEVVLERFDYDGQPAVIASVRDITERKRIDEERRRNEKLSTLGLLAGGVAHDFNNILSGIYGYSELLKLRSNDPRVLQCADRILQCGEQARKIIGGLLRFSRQSSNQAEEYNAHESIEAALELLKAVGAKNVEAKLDLRATEAQLFGFTGQLENALLNLFINARDAMPSGGTLTVSTSTVDLDLTAVAQLHPYTLRPGKFLRIQISDTGTGMTPEVRQRCMDPFFTTKGEHGTGLGLASVQGAIAEHRGAIQLDSTLGKGTTFTLLLPLAGTHAGSSVDLMPASSRLVLVVDDDKMIRDSTSELLEGFGIRTLTLPDGEDAVAYCTKHPGEVGVVTLDMSMRRMNGLETMLALRKMDPNIVVIFASGSLSPAQVDQLYKQGAQTVLGKPIPIQTLLDAVRKGLAKYVQPVTTSTGNEQA